MDKEKKTNKYSREIFIPKKTAERYVAYCKKTKMKLTEPLRVFILESIPQLHNAENLDQIIRRTREWNTIDEDCEKFNVRLPDEAIIEIHTYCKFFKLRRCHFLYYVIEDRLNRALEEVLKDEE